MPEDGLDNLTRSDTAGRAPTPAAAWPRNCGAGIVYADVTISKSGGSQSCCLPKTLPEQHQSPNAIQNLHQHEIHNLNLSRPSLLHHQATHTFVFARTEVHHPPKFTRGDRLLAQPPSGLVKKDSPEWRIRQPTRAELMSGGRPLMTSIKS
jgi:hypothetical protein